MRLLSIRAVCAAKIIFTAQIFISCAFCQNWWHAYEGEIKPLVVDSFQSASINNYYGYWLYLPPDYAQNTDKKYPVIYWLHGRDPSMKYHVVEMAKRLDAAIASGKAMPMILAGGFDPSYRSWWCNSKDGQRPLETLIADELVNHIDNSYRTLASREYRAIEGHSMGGHGAAMLGFRHHDTFAIVSMLCCAPATLDLLMNKAAGGYPEDFSYTFGSDADYFEQNNPYTSARENAASIRTDMKIRMLLAENDNLYFPWGQKYHALLDSLSVKHEYAEVKYVGHNHVALYDKIQSEPQTYNDWWKFYNEAFCRSSVFTHRPANCKPQPVASSRTEANYSGAYTLSGRKILCPVRQRHFSLAAQNKGIAAGN